MLVVISPAKKMDMSPAVGVETSTPAYAAQAADLAAVARELDIAALQKLMHISEKLAALNVERFQNFGTQDTKAAALAFAGDTYQGLEAATLDADEIRYAQDHLRILSGLYGLLRPLDAIEPYRLEMGSRLATKRGKSLYDYWGDRLAQGLNEQAQQTGSSVLVNCASQEYFGAVDLNALKLRVVTPVFMEEKGGTPKVVSFYAKKARGAMARYVMQNRITEAEDIKGFDLGGYQHKPDMSDGDTWVFLRGYPDAKST